YNQVHMKRVLLLLVLIPQISAAAQIDPGNREEIANRDIIQSAVARTLNRSNDAATGKIRLSSRLSSRGSVLAVCFSPTGKQVLIIQDVAAILYDLISGVELNAFRHSSFVISATFSPDGRTLLTGSVDGTARLWSVGTGAEIR